MNPLASVKPAQPPRSRKRAESPSRHRRAFAGLDVIDGAREEIALASRHDRRSFIICVQTCGSGTIIHDDASAAIADGETFVCAQPSRFVWKPDDAHARCLFVAGGPAFSLRFQPRRKTAVVMVTQHPLGLLLGDLCAQLASCVPASDPRLTQKLAEVLADFVDAALEQANNSVPARAFAANLVRAERRVDDPQFDPPALAAVCGLTLRSLQKRLKSLGTTPRQWILERRLERIRRKLDNPSLAHLSIRQIVLRSGFCDFSYVIRRFRGALGVSPGKYRRD